MRRVYVLPIPGQLKPSWRDLQHSDYVSKELTQKFDSFLYYLPQLYRT